MKTTLSAMAAALMLALPAYADDAHRHEGNNAMTTDENCPMHEGGAMPGGMGAMGKGMMGMMGQAGPGPDAMTSRMQQMEKRMDTMQKMMEQMMAKPPVAPAK